MNLVVDFGNTRVKAALFNGSELLQFKAYATIQSLLSDREFYKNAGRVIVGTVTEDHKILMEAWKEKEILLFESATPIPITNLYKSASTLGSDRIAASVGSFALHPNQNVLTIDAGTCIKYNFVNAANEYIGGAISPGLAMRLKSMHHYTSRLPDVAVDLNYEKLTGTTTEESLLSGALTGTVCEVDSMVRQYLETHEKLVVVLTGGDSDYLCKQLKNRFFANPYMVLYGLNTILNYNLVN